MVAGPSRRKRHWSTNPPKPDMTGANLQNKIAVVTGGAQGLGQAISQRLAREGCSVIIADVNEAGVNATASAIAAETKARVLGVKVDVTQENDVRVLFDRAIA